MRYFLIGYMGSGKSYQGRRMATSLGLPFIDLDCWIEQHEDSSIVTIFKEKGEHYFREKEREALQYIIKNYSHVIVATGGGTPCYFDNIERMNQAGETIFLNTSKEIIFQRLNRNRTFRPLIAQLTDIELMEFIEKHLAIRLPYYLKAKRIIVT